MVLILQPFVTLSPPMRRLLVVVFLVVPLTASAAESISRRDGFLLLWESVRRPALPMREKPFSDVVKGDRGFEEITYAKARGILDDDEESFRPDDPLLEEDALLWLFRTRSVDDIAELTRENLPTLRERYPLGPFDPAKPLTEEELLARMRLLDAILADEDHEVSLYAEKFNGKGTAFGETFDMHALTAAHRTFPHNTLVRVTNIENGKSVTVRINDRGPFVAGRDMDLSLAAFAAIADRGKGKIRARFERLGDASMVTGCGTEPREQRRIARGTILTSGVPHLLKLGKTLRLTSEKPFLVRTVRYPDGIIAPVNDWVHPGEEYSLQPSLEGEYIFFLRTVEGRGRGMAMRAISCPE